MHEIEQVQVSVYMCCEHSTNCNCQIFSLSLELLCVQMNVCGQIWDLHVSKLNCEVTLMQSDLERPTQ